MGASYSIAMATTEMDLADVNASIEVSSAAFGDEQQIPARYTSDGEGLSPPLEWTSTS